jgi:hypothetical protein
MVEGAVLSAATGRTVELSAVLESAYQVALQREERNDVRAALRGWGSASARLGIGARG